MAEETYQTVDLSTQNVPPNYRDNQRNKVEIDNHINKILGAEYFGKADGFVASNYDTNNVKREGGFYDNNQGSFYGNNQGSFYGNNQGGFYGNNQGGYYGNRLGIPYGSRPEGVSDNTTPLSLVTGRGRLEQIIQEQMCKEHDDSVDNSLAHAAPKVLDESAERGEYSSDTEVEDELQYEEDESLTAALNPVHSSGNGAEMTAALNPVDSSDNETGMTESYLVKDHMNTEAQTKSVEGDLVSNEAINSKINESMRERILGSLLGDNVKIDTPTPSSKKRSRKQPASTIKRKKQKLDKPMSNNLTEDPPTDEEMFETPINDQNLQNQTTPTSKRKRQRKPVPNTKVKQEPPVEIDNVNIEAAAADLLSLYTKPKFDDDFDPNKPHKCSFCGRGFKKRANLRRHILTHTGERAFACQKCGKTFSTSHAVKLHDRQHTGDKPYQCEKCLKKFTYYANYKIHLRSHSNDRPFPCDICGRSYTMSTTLKRHMKIHLENKPWKCEECPKQFSEEKQLKNHVIGHSSLRPFACSLCDKRFSQTYPLGKHMLKHAEEAYVDEIHPDAYKDGSVAALEGRNISDDNNVMNTDTEVEKEGYSTEISKKSAAEIDNMGNGSITHLEDLVKTPLRQSRCKVCKEVFVSLKQHMRVHMDRNPYYCTICSRDFLELTNLKQHLTTHTGAKPFACEDCGREFAQASNLKSHMRIHSGERPFVCPVCQKTFAHSSSMKNHVRFHTGEVCHYCSHCGRGFTDKSSLKKHVRTHTGEKPYCCVHCGRGFAASSSLKTHMFTHGGARPYQCDQTGCDKQFARPSQLQKHLLTRHKIDRVVESLFENEGGPRAHEKRNDKLNLSLDDNHDNVPENCVKSEQSEDTGDSNYVPAPIDYTLSSKMNDNKDFEIKRAMDDLNPLITQAIKQVDERPHFGHTSQLSDSQSAPDYVAIKAENFSSPEYVTVKAENSYTGGMLEQTAMPMYRGNI